MVKSPLFRLLQGAGFSCGALVVGIAFGIFLTPYMLSTLGEDAYGVYALASLFAGWCGLLDFGLTTTTSRYVTRYYVKGDDKGVDEVGSTAISLFGGISALVFLLACLAYVVARILGDRFDATGFLAPALFFAGASFALSKISDGVCGVVKGALRQELTGATFLFFRIAFGLTNFAILYFGGRVVALFVGNFVLTLIQLGVHIALMRFAVPSFSFSLRSVGKKRAKTLFNYSFFAFLAQAGEMFVDRSDLIVIAALLTMGDVAKYNLVVVTIASYFNSFLRELSSWQTNWFARLAALERVDEEARAEENGERGARVVATTRTFGAEFYESRAKIERASIYVSVFMALGIASLGRFFIERWIGSEYVGLFPVLALCIVFYGVYRGVAETNSRLLQGIARHRILAIGAAIHGVVNVCLSVLFVRCGLGLLGVALGTILPGLAIHFLWIPNATCRIIGERVLVYWKRTLQTLAIAGLASIAPYFVALNWGRPNYLAIIGLACVEAALYWGVVLLIGTNREERRIIGAFIARWISRK